MWIGSIWIIFDHISHCIVVVLLLGVLIDGSGIVLEYRIGAYFMCIAMRIGAFKCIAW